MTETTKAPIEVVGCDVFNPNPSPLPEGMHTGVVIGPGGHIFVRADPTDDEPDPGIHVRTGGWIRALEGGGFVIETAGALPDSPGDA